MASQVVDVYLRLRLGFALPYGEIAWQRARYHLTIILYPIYLISPTDFRRCPPSPLRLLFSTPLG